MGKGVILMKSLLCGVTGGLCVLSFSLCGMHQMPPCGDAKQTQPLSCLEQKNQFKSLSYIAKYQQAIVDEQQKLVRNVFVSLDPSEQEKRNVLCNKYKALERQKDQYSAQKKLFDTRLELIRKQEDVDCDMFNQRLNCYKTNDQLKDDLRSMQQQGKTDPLMREVRWTVNMRKYNVSMSTTNNNNNLNK